MLYSFETSKQLPQGPHGLMDWTRSSKTGTIDEMAKAAGDWMIACYINGQQIATRLCKVKS